ncbi:lysozyme inhibitor LprI family protein [Pseudochrobactrum sp. sp1633]|uniref:lysozyme inhibitor LprI family protein n=1 Tax=Pseudochrobactrum sp. sp1633 TaxID=3036706 RepID=UPI0025A67940|nr:lysozyme inhibitor LprI family protein [Pseudochrobactrum sp. sp1633]MDM8344589.1 lysozyme inhibitor LprI family protein [Pseudochrobactrum sp. sp1633]HWD13650.1 lysozyme inhibitor LprI family protein [Pseudochrobactrum sp.]
MIRQILLSIAAFFLIFLASLFPASAQEGCSNASTQQDMNKCAGQSYSKADARLNKLYKSIQQRLKGDKDTLKLFVNAQRAWIGYRDSECKFSSSAAADGSIYPLIYSQCLETLTKNRVQAFEAYLKCEEGDMSCPVPSAE